MSHESSTPDPVPDPRGTQPPLSWPLVVGFGSLALLWPLVDVVGLDEALGQPATALLVLAVVGLAWVLGAGLGRVPRPVATLTLAGVVYGVLLLGLSLALDVRPSVDGRIAAVVAIMEIARSAGLGALAGVLARQLQNSRARR